MKKLLTREEFRRTVLGRDDNRCVMCKKHGHALWNRMPGITEGWQDTVPLAVHHIFERKLFKDGGYYESNGVTLCEQCHIQAEACFIMPTELWTLIGIDIDTVIYPDNFNYDEDYDKWGQIVLYERGNHDFVVAPNRFVNKFIKAVEIAKGSVKKVNSEWLHQHMEMHYDQDALYIVKPLKAWLS